MRNTLKTFLCMVIIMFSVQLATAYDAAWVAIEDYNGVAGDLSFTIDEGEKFAEAIELYGLGLWDIVFYWINDNAWESDFKDDSFGGNDSSYIDAVDLALFAGHGGPGYIVFSTQNDDYYLTYDEVRWGDNDLEWIIFIASNVLNNDDSGVWSRWTQAFAGLHYILGYAGICHDYGNRGELFIRYAMEELDNGYTVRNAWINTTIISESGTRAAYLRAEDDSSDTYNDHLWGFGTTSSDPTGTLTIWYHTWNT